MNAAVFEGPEKLVVRDMPLGKCGPRDIVIKVHACGVCGSDVRNYLAGLRYGIKEQIMGHEFSGIVSETGKEVTKFKVGDRLAGTPDVTCGECYYCKRGLGNLCNNHRMLGTNWPGGFAEYIHIPAEVIQHGIIHHLPEGMSLKDAALSEPSSSVIASQKQIGVGVGDTIVIFGDGPIGCLHTEVARASGVKTIIMVGLNRLETAKRFSPDYLIDAASEDPVKEIRRITSGLGADAAICANPVASTQGQAVESVRKRGKVVLFGGVSKTDPMTSLNSNTIHYSEISVVGSFSYPVYMHQTALDFIHRGIINPEKYFDLTVPLDRIVDAFEAARSGKALKALVTMEGNKDERD
jgi:L-iditol 2-dehydrogenase